MSHSVYILNGPNLNLLGTREPEVYGHETLGDIETACRKQAETLGYTLTFRQSNHEGELVDWVQEAGSQAQGLILNPAAYTHTSVALHDALKAISIPSIEIHLSQPGARESFRKRSYIAPAVSGTISGFGKGSYLLALNALEHLLT